MTNIDAYLYPFLLFIALNYENRQNSLYQNVQVCKVFLRAEAGFHAVVTYSK